MTDLPSSKTHPDLPTCCSVGAETLDGLREGTSTFGVEVANCEAWPDTWCTRVADDDTSGVSRVMEVIAQEHPASESGKRRWLLVRAPGAEIETHRFGDGT